MLFKPLHGVPLPSHLGFHTPQSVTTQPLELISPCILHWAASRLFPTSPFISLNNSVPSLPSLPKLLASVPPVLIHLSSFFLFPHVSSPQPSDVPCQSSSLPGDSAIHRSIDHESTKVVVLPCWAMALLSGSTLTTQLSLLSPSPQGRLPSVRVDCGVFVSPLFPHSFPQTVTNLWARC